MTANFPSNHSQRSLPVILPPGPNGPGFMSPSLVHLPTQAPSFSCSGPGFGAAGGAWASATPATTRLDTQAARLRAIVFVFIASPPCAPKRRGQSDHSLVQHRVGDLQEAGDVGAV